MADEVWARDLVQTLLERCHKAGEEGLSADELQEKGGIGPGDLETTLGVMIDEGSARRTDEGLYEFVPPEERAEPETEGLDPDDPDRVEAELARPVPGADNAATAEDRRRAAEAASNAERRAQVAPPQVELVGGPVIRLTKGMVNALSHEALGEMVKAAIEEHSGDDELTIAIAK